MELGEIEHHLKLHMPTAKQIVARLTSNLTRKDVLTAFIGLKQPEDDGAGRDHASSHEIVAKYLGRLEENLRHDIPSYMIPSEFFIAQEFPQTPSGKLDRRILRKLAEGGNLGNSLSFANCEDARNENLLSEMENLLLAFWNQVLLAQTQANSESNFFHRGGDSVNAITLVHLLRCEGLLLTVQDILSYPKLKDMAAIIKQITDPKESRYAPMSLLPAGQCADIVFEAVSQCRINAEMIEDIYPCTPLQEGLMAMSQLQKGSYVARHEFVLNYSWSWEHINGAWLALLHEIPILRTRIISSASHGCFQVVIKYETSFVPVNNAIPIGPARGSMAFGDPLCHTEFVESELENRYQWLLTIHHAIYDA